MHLSNILLFVRPPVKSCIITVKNQSIHRCLHTSTRSITYITRIKLFTSQLYFFFTYSDSHKYSYSTYYCMYIGWYLSFLHLKNSLQYFIQGFSIAIKRSFTAVFKNIEIRIWYSNRYISFKDEHKSVLCKSSSSIFYVMLNNSRKSQLKLLFLWFVREFQYRDSFICDKCRP